MGGFLIGLALVYLGQQKIVENTGFLDSISVERVAQLEIDKSMFFVYSVRERIGPAALLVLLAAAGAGGLAVCLYLVWTGFCAGVILSVLSLRYGIRGLLLFLGGTLPQIFLLIPAYLMLFQWCVSFPGRSGMLKAGTGGKAVFKAVRLGSLLTAAVLLVLGCLAESYVNPVILRRFFLFF